MIQTGIFVFKVELKALNVLEMIATVFGYMLGNLLFFFFLSYTEVIGKVEVCSDEQF